MRGSVKTKVERGLYEELTSDVCASDPFASAHFSPPEGSNLALFQRNLHCMTYSQTITAYKHT